MNRKYEKQKGADLHGSTPLTKDFACKMINRKRRAAF